MKRIKIIIISSVIVLTAVSAAQWVQSTGTILGIIDAILLYFAAFLFQSKKITKERFRFSVDAISGLGMLLLLYFRIISNLIDSQTFYIVLSVIGFQLWLLRMYFRKKLSLD